MKRIIPFIDPTRVGYLQRNLGTVVRKRFKWKRVQVNKYCLKKQNLKWDNLVFNIKRLANEVNKKCCSKRYFIKLLRFTFTWTFSAWTLFLIPWGKYDDKVCRRSSEYFLRNLTQPGPWWKDAILPIRGPCSSNYIFYIVFVCN